MNIILYGFIFFLAYIYRVTQPALDEEWTESDGKNENLISQTLPIIDGKDNIQSLDL